jgi:hypothetical protein
VFPPAVTISGTAALFGTTNVSGPGQNRSASRAAVDGHFDATFSTSAARAT